ncbi:MAG: indolepyruvate oxidoreductase subunit beta [Chloroflexi bacterium]|nr:indolepyruvate oxidoreductase subunit beta [Chloroflexota bacterium]
MGDLTRNFYVVGVGGQGTLLAADVIATLGMLQGLDVKKSEIHGMAQRGGSVSSQVRWGSQVFSPVFVAGEADCVIALEQLEALRSLHWLKPGGIALISDYRINPVAVTMGRAQYPSNDAVSGYLADVHSISVPAMQLAIQAGESRTNNVVMLGVLAAQYGLNDALIRQALELSVPERFLEANLRALQAGRAYYQERGQDAH